MSEQHAAVSAVLHQHRDLLHLQYSPTAWRILEDLSKVLQPFKDATTYFSASRYPTVSILSPVLHEILTTLEKNYSSTSVAICQVKNVIVSDLRTRYQDDEVRMLLNKASLLDPQVKSLVHLTEEEQTRTVDNLVNEIVIEFSPFSSEEPVLEDTEPMASSSQVQADQEHTSSGTSGEPVKKKCMLEKLLGDTFANNPLDNSVTVLCSGRVKSL